MSIPLNFHFSVLISFILVSQVHNFTENNNSEGEKDLRAAFLECSSKCSAEVNCAGIVIYKKIDTKLELKKSNYFCRTESTTTIALADDEIVYKIIFKGKLIETIEKSRKNFRQKREGEIDASTLGSGTHGKAVAGGLASGATSSSGI